VESSCKLGNEPSGSIKCWELPSGYTTCGLSSGTQLHRVSYLVSKLVNIKERVISFNYLILFSACNFLVVPLGNFSTMKMGALLSSVTSVDLFETTRCYSPQDGNIHSYCSKDLKRTNR
jgi:hypothetical protein